MQRTERPGIVLTTCVLAILAGAWSVARLFGLRESNLPLSYVLPLMACVWSRRPWQLWMMALLFGAITTAKIFWITPELSFGPREVYAIYFTMLFNIGVGALAIHALIVFRERLELRSDQMQANNLALQAKTQELAAGNEEIKSLLGQLKERNSDMEAQSQTLRAKNDDLRWAQRQLESRGRMLEMIVAAARSPKNDQNVVRLLCEQAADVIGPPARAVAVLNHEGDALCVSSQSPAPQKHEDAWLNDEVIAYFHRLKVAPPDDDTARDAAGAIVKAFGDHSVLAAPIRQGRDISGWIVGRGGNEPWTDEQQRVIVWIAAHCAMLQERLRWQQALRSHAEEVDVVNRAKDDFLAMLSHELRTPLTPVLAAASGLSEDPRLPRELQDDLRVIQRNVAIQSRLIDDLLDLTRIAKGKIELHRRTLNVAALLREAAAIVAADLDAKEQRLDIQLRLPPDTSLIGDGARLQQVLWNLLKNAIKFSPANSEIKLTAFAENPGHVIVEVSDTGIGINPTDLQRIFHPFEQVRQRRLRDEGAGIGLGLSIAKSIVELHGGALVAMSAGSGKGATFRVQLPRSNASLAAVEQKPAHPPTQDSAALKRATALRVLLVEDHVDTGRLMTKLLKSHGYDVQWAKDAGGAMSLFQSSPFDVMVSDLGLPDESGLELMRKVRAMRTDFPAICLSGFGFESDIAASQAAGFGIHLTKPVDFSQLTEAINRTASV